MFSVPICAMSKNKLMEIFETLAHFPGQILIKSGDYTVDAHSLIGVFSLDISQPMELLTEFEPDEKFMQEIRKFSPVAA